MTDAARKAFYEYAISHKLLHIDKDNLATGIQGLDVRRDDFNSGYQAAITHILTQLQSEEMREVVARALANRRNAEFPGAQIVASHFHYEPDAQAATAAIVKKLGE